jgi:hypothetical protein
VCWALDTFLEMRNIFFDGHELQEAAAAAIDMEGAHAGAALGGQGMNGQQGPAARVAGLDSSSLVGCWNTEYYKTCRFMPAVCELCLCRTRLYPLVTSHFHC